MDKIVTAVLSSLIGALIAFLASSTMGLFEKKLSASQVQDVAYEIVNSAAYQKVILDAMKSSGSFLGPQGPQGLRGEKGPAGPAGEGNRILSLLVVKNGSIENSSTGVQYNSDTGIVTFPNPDKLKFIPLVTDLSSGTKYIASTHFVRGDFASVNQFKVWRTAMDTSDRNSSPDSFTAIAVGF